MTDQPDIQSILDAAPPGKILEGTVEIHKSTIGRIMLVAKIGETEYRKVLPKAALKMLTGGGPGSALLRRVFGGGEERGPADDRGPEVDAP